MKFKLHEIFGGAIDRIVICSGAKPGTETNKRVTFKPGEIYSLNDPVAVEYIKGNLGDVRQKQVMTDALRAELKYYGIPYEVKKCGSCAVAKPKAFFNPFKIIEE